MDRILIFILAFVLFDTVYAFSQEIENPGKILIEQVGNVKGKKKEFEQKIEQNNHHPYVVEIAIKEINSGKEIFMSVNAIDLNPSRVLFEAKKDMVEIKAQATGGRKLVKVIEDDNLENYVSEIVIYSSEIEEARIIKDALEEFVKIVHNNEKQTQQTTFSKDTLLQQVQSNTVGVTINDDSYKQKFDSDLNNSNIIFLEKEDISKAVKEEYKFNLADLYQNQIGFETSRNQVFVSIKTKGESKLIGYKKNGDIGNYRNNVKVMMPSVEAAREYSKNLKHLVQIANDEETTDYAGYDYNECVQFLNKNIGQVDINQDSYVQSFEVDTENNYIFSISSQDVTKGDKYTYKVNAADLKKGKTQFGTKGNEVIIKLETHNSEKLISTIKNEKISNYVSSYILRTSDIEIARAVSEVFTRFKELGRNAMDNLNAFNSINEAELFMKNTVGKLVINTDTYDQSIEPSNENNCIYSYEITDVSKDVHYRYELNLQDVDVHKIRIGTKGPQVFVGIETKGKKKLIKSYKNGEVDKFIYQFIILMSDIEQARRFIAAIKVATVNCN